MNPLISLISPPRSPSYCSHSPLSEELCHHLLLVLVLFILLLFKILFIYLMERERSQAEGEAGSR